MLKDFEHRLVGFELDPFAAWVSQLVLGVVLIDLRRSAFHSVSSLEIHRCYSDRTLFGHTRGWAENLQILG